LGVAPLLLLEPATKIPITSAIATPTTRSVWRPATVPNQSNPVRGRDSPPAAGPGGVPTGGPVGGPDGGPAGGPAGGGGGGGGGPDVGPVGGPGGGPEGGSVLIDGPFHELRSFHDPQLFGGRMS
jgi:hypothetical protein